VHFPAAVSALSAVDPGLYATGGSKDSAVNFLRVRMAFGLQEPAKPEIFVLFFFCLLAYLDKIESHSKGL
jgi:hypothetical protein